MVLSVMQISEVIQIVQSEQIKQQKMIVNNKFGKLSKLLEYS